MRLDDREGPGPLIDPTNVLDGNPLDEEGGSDVLKLVMREMTTEAAVHARKGLEIRVVPFIVGLLESNRKHIAVVLLLASSNGNMVQAARTVLAQNGLPDTMREMGVQLSREGQGITLNYGPAISAVVSAVQEHLKLSEEEDTTD